jgi:hypothetical protein
VLSYNESYVLEKATSKAKLKISKFLGKISGNFQFANSPRSFALKYDKGYFKAKRGKRQKR